MPGNAAPVMMRLEHIRLNGGTQMRECIDQDTSNGGDENVDLSMMNVAVFARRDGKWYCILGQETPVRE